MWLLQTMRMSYVSAMLHGDEAVVSNDVDAELAACACDAGLRPRGEL